MTNVSEVHYDKVPLSLSIECVYADCSTWTLYVGLCNNRCLWDCRLKFNRNARRNQSADSHLHWSSIISAKKRLLDNEDIRPNSVPQPGFRNRGGGISTFTGTQTNKVTTSKTPSSSQSPACWTSFVGPHTLILSPPPPTTQRVCLNMGAEPPLPSRGYASAMYRSYFATNACNNSNDNKW